MNFTSMEYFIAVAQERSFTRAAERLHITQQTLSAHIAGIEQQLGSRLLFRSIPLELTYAGQVFLAYAQDIQQNLRSMEREFDDIARNKRGLLRIGVAPARGHAIMPPLIQAFQARYPSIAVRLTEATNDTLFQALVQGECDLAVANFPDTLPGVELVEFYREQIVLLLPRALSAQIYGAEEKAALEKIRRGDLSPLRDFPLLLNSEQNVAGRIGRGLLHQSDLTPSPIVESDHIEILLGLCARGCGACFCPENLIRTTLTPKERSGIYQFSFPSQAQYDIRLGYRKQSYQWSVISDFIQLAQQMAPDFS